MKKISFKQNYRGCCALFMVILMGAVLPSCASTPANSQYMNPAVTKGADSNGLKAISDITAYEGKRVSQQAYEVVMSNAYSEEYFGKVFQAIVSNLKESRKKDNAVLILENFCNPLIKNAHVPPGIVKRYWNYYFSREFVSTPKAWTPYSECQDLTGVKQEIIKEYNLKRDGFDICNWESPDELFVRATNVYNYMWACCNPPE